jgi:hypothetical protein
MPLIKYNNQSLSSITALPSAIPTGKLKLISSQTASNSASISFTTGLSSTYKVYKFVFVDINPTVDNAQFHFQCSTDGGSSYATTLTSTFFYAYHFESDTPTALGYDATMDQAQGTAFQRLIDGIGSEADESGAGSMTLFNPASTTYVKHYISRCNSYVDGTFTTDYYSAGYFNTTSAINAVQFKCSSGNFDGKIYLYAIDNS